MAESVISNSVQAGAEASASAIELKRARDAAFFRKGIGIGLFSGITYGLYTAFIMVAQNKGIWLDWGQNLAAASFLVIFILPTIASAINDLCSAIWALAVTAKQGKLADFGRTLASKPGMFMIFAALCGGPIANAAYIIALTQAGPIVTPISALCPAIGAILARILFKQKMGPRVIIGILICVAASGLIGITSLTGEIAPGIVVGLLLALGAALGWGIEGCVAGFGTAMIDSQIGITIRQTTSGLANLFIMLPVLSVVGSVNLGESFGLVAEAVSSTPSFIFFIISGLFAYVSFATWYKGNSMCGTALGMALNGTYTFFGPLFTWLIVGLVMGLDGYALEPIAWVSALLMSFGIWVISMNPLDIFKKKEA